MSFSPGASIGAYRVEGRTLDQLIPPAGLEIAQFFDIAVALGAGAAGLRQEAPSWARKAWEIRDPFQYFARYHPDDEWLRAEPEFQAILREMDAAPATTCRHPVTVTSRQAESGYH